MAAKGKIWEEAGCYVFLALFLIQIGVPKNPKASRIWFSKKRW
jgi:hypothetical protein